MTWWKQNGNTVLTFVEFIGFVGTVVTTAMAAPKVYEKIKEMDISKENLTPKKAIQVVRTVGKDCLKPFIFATVTVGAMAGCKRQYSNQAAIASAYTVGKHLYDEHKEKIQEIMDDICPEPKTTDIEESIIGDPKKRNKVFFLEYSGRRFIGDPEAIENALYELDDYYQLVGLLSGNDIYNSLGIVETKLGVDNGFADCKRLNNPEFQESDHLDWSINDVTGEDGKTIGVISFSNYLDNVVFYQTFIDQEKELFDSL